MIRRLPHGSRILPLLALLAALAVAGCGDGGGGSSSSAAPAADGPDPATLVPADAVLYGEALLRPSGDVEAGAVAAMRKVTRTADPAAELLRLLDEGAEHVTFSEDIDPWLGDRVAAFLPILPAFEAESEAGIVAAVRDEDSLDGFLQRERDSGELRPAGAYRGISYDNADDASVAVLGELLVIGTGPAVVRAAIDVSKEGESLADEPRYRDAVDELDDDTLGFLYADPRGFADGLRRRDDLNAGARELLSSDALAQAEPVTVSLTADADEIVLEGTADNGLADLAGADEDTGEVTVGQLPGDAWLALATPPIGPLVRKLLDATGVHDEARVQVRRALGLDLDRDLLDVLGGLGLFARGSSVLDIGAGALLQMADATSAGRLLTRIQAIAGAASGGATRSVELSGARGFELQIPQSPQPIVVLAKGDRIAAGYAASSATDLLDPQQRFEDSSTGSAAIATLGEGFTPSFVLIAPPLVNLLRALDQLQVADLSDVLPYLSAYESLAIGTKRDDETTVRVVVALR